MIKAPERVYKAAVFDSTRWTGFVHRPGDIFVCTPPKCGTTWVQTIVASLLFADGDIPGVVMEMSPWLDARFEPIDTLLARLDAQTHRRFVKTHTPADGIPWFDTASYIAVGRDGRDAFMSYANHMTHMRRDLIARLNEEAAADGVAPMPVYDGDIHAFFARWIAGGDTLHNIATWWARRDEPNVLLVHYNDLKADLEGEMRRVAAFCGIDVPDDRWPAVVQRCTFEAMRAQADRISDFESKFVGGAESFLYKGTNGRWHDVLTADELALYDKRVTEILSEDAARWLERGSLALSVRP
jgi:aryl sulfotransferase